MKKIRVRKGVAAAAALCVLFLAACGEAEERETAETFTAEAAFAAGEADAQTQSVTNESEVKENDGLSGGTEGAAADEMRQEKETDAEIVTWDASIEAVGTDSFTVSEIFTDVLEDGSLIAVGQVGDAYKKLIEVTYTEQTVFTIRTTKNSGMEYRDSPGTSADLEEERSCVLTGSWDGDLFQASEVMIYHHQ